ncbi:MAG: hypothetical protein ACOVP1_06580 [Bacteroidia bacterium]
MSIKIWLIFTLIFGFGNCFSQSRIWQTYPEESKKQIETKFELYSNEQTLVNNLVKEFYKGNFIPSDNKTSLMLIDTLVYSKLSDTALISLYNFMFFRMVKKSDGALSENLESYMPTFILKYPFQFIGQIKFDENLEQKMVYLLAEYFYYSEKSNFENNIKISEFERLVFINSFNINDEFYLKEFVIKVKDKMKDFD